MGTEECPVPQGVLVIIGGKEDKGEGKAPDRETPSGFVTGDILRIFTHLTQKEQPVIQVITSGSSEGEEMFAEYRKIFGELGCEKTLHLHHACRGDVLTEDPSELVSNPDAFFFAGGDQLLLTSLYGGTPFLTALKERYIREPVVIAGTSAGAMAMSTPMIFAGNEEVQEISGEIKVTTGLEFLRDVCVDTHFVHRGRFVRLAQVIATNPGCIGLGIEEDTAVIVRKGIEAEVAGSGTVFVVEGFSITSANMKNFTEKKPFSVRNLKVDILAPGDLFRIEQRNPPHR